MKISTKGRYALRMLLDLAEHQNDGYIALKDIAARQDISKKYLEQIIPILNKSGFLLASRGFQGGYRLAKHPINTRWAISCVRQRAVFLRLHVWTTTRYFVRGLICAPHLLYGKD